MDFLAQLTQKHSFNAEETSPQDVADGKSAFPYYYHVIFVTQFSV